MRVILFCISFFSAFMLSAQVQLRVNFEQDTVMLGDTIGLNYEVLVLPNTEITAVDIAAWDSIYTIEQMQQAAADSTINWEDVYDAKNQFEILNYGRWMPNEMSQSIPAANLNWRKTPGKQSGQRVFSNRLTAVFWAEGNYLVPHAKIEYQVGNQSGRSAPSGAANKVTVVAPTALDVSKIDTLTQLTPIKPILEEPLNWKDFMWLYVALFVLVLGFVLYKYLTKKEPEVEEPEPEVVLPPHTIALQKLEQLKSAQLWQKGEVKEYQSRLTYILREYLENRYNIQALESTTGEINEDLRKADVTEAQRNKLRELLQVADLVKFAKAEPPETFHTRVLDESFDFIETTKVEIREVENIESNKDEID